MRLQKIIYFFLFSLMLQSMNANTLAPDDTIRLNPVQKSKPAYPRQPTIVKNNPNSIIWGPVVLTAQYMIVVEVPTSKNQSMQVGISYLGKSPIWSVIEQKTKGAYHPLHFVISGYSLQIANKFYLVRKKYGAPFGFYVAPEVCYSNAHISMSVQRYYRKNYVDATQFSASLIAGLQVGRKKRFTTDVFAGVGYKKNIWFYHVNSFQNAPFPTKDFGKFFNSDVKITLGITFGWTIY